MHIQLNLESLLNREEYHLAHDLACERLADAAASTRERIECALVACKAASFLGDAAEAISQGEAAYVMAKMAGEYDLLARAIHNTAHAYEKAGLYSKALERISEFEKHKQQYSPEVLQDLEARAAFARAVLYRNLNRLDEAREHMQIAYDLATARSSPKADEYRSNLVYIMLRQGDTEAALALIQGGDAFRAETPAVQALHDLRQIIDRAHYALVKGEAATAYDLCVEAAGANPTPDLRAQILKVLQELALSIGRVEESLGLAVLAAQAAEEAGRRDLLVAAEETALTLAQRFGPADLEQILAELRSVSVS